MSPDAGDVVTKTSFALHLRIIKGAAKTMR